MPRSCLRPLPILPAAGRASPSPWRAGRSRRSGTVATEEEEEAAGVMARGCREGSRSTSPRGNTSCGTRRWLTPSSRRPASSPPTPSSRSAGHGEPHQTPPPGRRQGRRRYPAWFSRSTAAWFQFFNCFLKYITSLTNTTILGPANFTLPFYSSI
ncbi:uncharacterized protein LOC127779009 [Oryza glaberrima]|uniref:uncharacterized protein LOC127779009 n=1 Tax=Oryza glaberrima TaxID=4538 RepID=UPI00224C5335|nr:uncharacterized protein LOC127779009 [Oryza glaberrima]